MTTAREAFEAKKLAQRYGVVGKVAGRYREAGYQVEVAAADEESPVNFTAYKKGEKLAVKVVWRSGPVALEVVDSLAEAAEGAKPVLVLYGAGPKATGALLERAREKGVSIRRVRA